MGIHEIFSDPKYDVRIDYERKSADKLILLFQGDKGIRAIRTMPIDLIEIGAYIVSIAHHRICGTGIGVDVCGVLYGGAANRPIYTPSNGDRIEWSERRNVLTADTVIIEHGQAIRTAATCLPIGAVDMVKIGQLLVSAGLCWISGVHP